LHRREKVLLASVTGAEKCKALLEHPNLSYGNPALPTAMEIGNDFPIKNSKQSEF